MTAMTKTGATSRAASARPASVARTIVKRREKPYKTEENRVLGKKKKLDLQTVYRSKPPAGFTLVQVGTPDLSNRCKELSRQRGLPVYLVNGAPVSKHAIDPYKVSHHVHRLGYHFRTEVVEDACQELGYVSSKNTFVKEADLVAREQQTKMARALAKFGVQYNQASQEHETNDQVRAAIKELFPKIPNDDLEAIMKHAWEEGTGRVGNNSHLSLPRRVQLATIARIRHTYTDYDKLLRAFEWKEARSIVEPGCLQKLIEWRGETEDDEDNDLEEIVRETIVIDDDEDAIAARGSEADDEDSAVEDYNSDTSIEITHRLAADDDLGAESHDEHSQQFLQRYHAPARNVQQRHLAVRQKIGEVREQMRNGTAPALQQIIQVHVPDDGQDIIEINGQRFRRAPPPVQTHRPVSQQYVSHSLPQRSAYSDIHQQSAAQRHAQPAPRYTNSADGHDPYHRPIASIEQQDELRRVAMVSAAATRPGSASNHDRPRPRTPDAEHFDKRRRVDFPGPVAKNGYHHQRYSPPVQDARHHGSRYPDSRLGESVRTSREVNPNEGQSSGYPATRSSLGNAPRALQHVEQREMRRGPLPLDSELYDPQRPLLRIDNRRHGHTAADAWCQHQPSSGFVDAQVAPIQYAPHPAQSMSQYPGVSGSRPHEDHRPQSDYTVSQHPQVVWIQAPPPVHGAPAAVQQLPREPTVVQVSAANGYLHPSQRHQPQYYYPR